MSEMEIVLDTSSFQHLIRFSPSPSAHSRVISNVITTSIDNPLKQGKLTLAIDDKEGLIGEWSSTCGDDCVKVLIDRWAGLGAVNLVTPARSINNPISNKLRQFGFTDTIDKLVLRIAVKTSDRTVVADDGDFWDPANNSLKGNPNACVAKLCGDSLNIRILLLATMLSLI